MQKGYDIFVVIHYAIVIRGILFPIVSNFRRNQCLVDIGLISGHREILGGVYGRYGDFHRIKIVPKTILQVQGENKKDE
jgi:hypothetical protein